MECNLTVLKILLYIVLGICSLVLVILSKKSGPILQTHMALAPQHQSQGLDRENTPEHPGPPMNNSYLYWSPIGRLGNQIFEFSAAFCTALQSNHTPTIPQESSLLSLFQIPDAIRLGRVASHGKAYREKKCCILSPHILENAMSTTSPLKIYGFFHSYKYMLPCWEVVKREFVLNKDIQEEVENEMNTVLGEVVVRNQSRDQGIADNARYEETFTFIGVHVRRTDRKATYPPIAFFKKAFKYYEEKYSNVVFFVCSDDIKWCEKELPAVTPKTSNIMFMSSRTNDYRVDFGILVNCHHSIVTAGTFSWWSGWLAGGEVVYHTGYDHWQQTFHSGRYKHEDFYPPEWIPMD